MSYPDRKIQLRKHDGDWAAGFHAMASPCVALTSGVDKTQTRKIAKLITKEVWRIQDKYSRYDPQSTLSRINSRAGTPTRVDTETARLLDTAKQLYAASNRGFDITSGVLRKAWYFDGSDSLPEPAEVETLMHKVGWDKIQWQSPMLHLRENMEIDFGGIGKEYAADAALERVRAQHQSPMLINLGGDICVSGPRQNQQPWLIGVENPGHPGTGNKVIELSSGALATSGTSHCFVRKNGMTYGHILDPRTGWPVVDAPLSVTVAAPTCSEAGMWATLAMLQGALAETFLRQESGRQHWVKR